MGREGIPLSDEHCAAIADGHRRKKLGLPRRQPASVYAFARDFLARYAPICEGRLAPGNRFTHNPSRCPRCAVLRVFAAMGVEGVE